MMEISENFQKTVIDSCANPLPENIVSQYGNRVIKISHDKVVKWGPDITKEEAENQRIAYELVDNHIVHIPRVYAFFSDEREWGYIIMEFIDGKIVNPLEDVNSIKRIANVLNYFSTLRSNIPGSLCGGYCRGLLFPETEDLVFNNVDDMEKWFNSRLFAHDPKLTFHDCELVFCHLDIAPRNFLWKEDGSFCLIDWASAGFYPRLFEFCMQWIIEGKDGNFNSLLLESMNPLSSQELMLKESIMCAWRNTQSQPKILKSSPRISKKSTGISPIPPHPMPEYPPDWCEQSQREQLTSARIQTNPSPLVSINEKAINDGLFHKLAVWLGLRAQS